MSIEELQNSPLHAVSAETMLTELVTFYGWEILDAAMDLKCLRIKPTIPSCLTFLQRADWAMNKVEHFYLSCFKQMPKLTDEEIKSEIKPRERGFPVGVKPQKPLTLTIEQAEDWKEDQIRAEMGEEPRAESSFKSKFSDFKFKKA